MIDENSIQNAIRLFKNFGASMIKWGSKDNLKLAGTEELEKRREICTKCDDWNPTAFGGLGKCNICGCSVGKLYIPSSVCPATPPKWGPITGSYSFYIDHTEK